MAKEFTLCAQIAVRAPIERCFQLSTSIAIVELELKMHPVRGRTSGFVQLGDTVLWSGWKFGFPQYHESLIDAFDPPVFFRDRMISGRFASFWHEHRFRAQADGCILMMDELRFTMPFGPLGVVVGHLVLVPHIRGLLRKRMALLKSIAESEEWRRFLPASDSPARPHRAP